MAVRASKWRGESERITRDTTQNNAGPGPAPTLSARPGTTWKPEGSPGPGLPRMFEPARAAALMCRRCSSPPILPAARARRRRAKQRRGEEKWHQDLRGAGEGAGALAVGERGRGGGEEGTADAEAPEQRRAGLAHPRPGPAPRGSPRAPPGRACRGMCERAQRGALLRRRFGWCCSPLRPCTKVSCSSAVISATPRALRLAFSSATSSG